MVMLLTIVAGGYSAKAKTGVRKFSLKKESVTLYYVSDPEKKDEAKNSDYKSYGNIGKLVKGFDTEKYDITLKTADKSIVSVSSKKDRIYARGIGTVAVTVKVKEKETGKQLFKSKLKVTVEENPDFIGSEEDPETEITLKQTAADRLLLEGVPEDWEIFPEDLTVYEEQEGVTAFFSYVSKVVPDYEKAEIVLFRCPTGGKKYILEYDGMTFSFIAGKCTRDDVDRFEIVEKTVRAGEGTELSFRYYNSDGMDITAAVKAELDPKVKLTMTDPLQMLDAYISGRKLYILSAGKKISVGAKVFLSDQEYSLDAKLLSTTAVIESLPPKGESFSGNTAYSLKSSDSKYLTWGEKCVNSVPLGDSVIFEALFEMDDGSIKDLRSAGVNKILVGDMKVAMIGSQTSDGGYKLILNNEGNTSIICYKDDVVVGNFKITVLSERKPSELKVDLSKKILNTNYLTYDYIIIKADVFDQYGNGMDVKDFAIRQDDFNKSQAGEVSFIEMSPGRFIVYGYECKADKEQKLVSATVSWQNISENISFFIKDVEYDPSDSDYTYKLEADGSLLIDTAPGLRNEPPKSTFVTVKVSKDGYYMNEGTGIVFDDLPSVKNGASFYGVDPGTCLYGITIEHTDENGQKAFLKDDGICIVATYYDMEFVPYTRGAKLKTGTYEINAYRIVAKENLSDIKICDTMTIRVIDSDPEIEVIQKAQTYSEKEKDWLKAIPKYFSFLFDGEDVSKYITKVDCVEGATGSVFIRSVDFMIPDPYFGMFSKTVLVERLITKQ